LEPAVSAELEEAAAALKDLAAQFSPGDGNHRCHSSHPYYTTPTK
jgi:hypothetical protein